MMPNWPSHWFFGWDTWRLSIRSCAFLPLFVAGLVAVFVWVTSIPSNLRPSCGLLVGAGRPSGSYGPRDIGVGNRMTE